MNVRPHKVIVLGETNVGKTAILQTFIKGTFPQKVSSTLGATFHRHSFKNNKGETFSMDLWDTAGQEKYRSLLNLYYKNSDGVLLIFDISEQSSFQAVKYWARELEQHCQEPPAVILVGNKTDLLDKKKRIPEKTVQKFLDSRKKWEYLQCSAKQNKNIRQVFSRLTQLIQKNSENRRASRADRTSKQKLKFGSSLSSKNSSNCC